jgi:hypothetical protein
MRAVSVWNSEVCRGNSGPWFALRRPFIRDENIRHALEFDDGRMHLRSERARERLALEAEAKEGGLR